MFRTTICATGLLAACLLPQSESRLDGFLGSTTQPTANSQSTTSFGDSTKGRFTVSQQRRQLDSTIAETAKSLRQAKSDEEKDAAEKKLRELLGKDYDQRLEGYEDELKRLEQTLKDMRKRLQKRRDAKDEMIDLRIKVLEAEAEDLGWPARHTRSAFPSLIRGRSKTLWETSPTENPKPDAEGVK